MRTALIALAAASLAYAPAIAQPATTKTETEIIVQALDVFCGWNQHLGSPDAPVVSGRMLQSRAEFLGWKVPKGAPNFAQRQDKWGYALIYFTQNDKGAVCRVEERPAIPPDATRDPKAVMAAVEGWIAKTLPGARKTTDRGPASTPAPGHAITIWEDPKANRTVTIYESPDSDARILNVTLSFGTTL